MVTSVRLPPDIEAFYKKQAASKRMDYSTLIRKTLIEGAGYLLLEEFEARISHQIDQVQKLVEGSSRLPEQLQIDLASTHLMLSEIYLNSRSPSDYSTLTEKAKQKTKVHYNWG